MNHKPLSLYIHWPFCASKCPYCDFNSHVRESVDQAAWQEAMLSELRWLAQSITPRPLVSIFFGGGTPSLMPPATVEALLTQAEALFGFAPNCEITLEANPTSVEAANFANLAVAGINRVSLGVQSFQPAELAFLGRMHSVDEAKQAIALATTHMARFSFDLIYALPEQSLPAWRTQLHDALDLAQGHLSLYQLTIEPGTNFFHQHQAGAFIMPEEELAADFYHLTQTIMDQAKMPAYEVSNHAAAGQASRHNVNYWQSGDYLGLGPGAHGRITLDNTDNRHNARHATFNYRSPEKWLTQVQQHGHGQAESTLLSHQEHLEEAIMMGLRLCSGLARHYLPSHVQHAHSSSSLHDFWPTEYLTSLSDEGLIEPISRDQDSIRATMKGRLLLGSLTTGLATALLPDHQG